MNFISKYKWWIIGAIILIIILVIIYNSGKKTGEIKQANASGTTAVVVNPYSIPPYGGMAKA